MKGENNEHNRVFQFQGEGDEYLRYQADSGNYDTSHLDYCKVDTPAHERGHTDIHRAASIVPDQATLRILHS